MFAWQGMNYVLPLITLPYLARVLQPAQFGILGFTTSIVAYAGMFTDWGFSLSATHLVAANRDDKTRLNEIFWATLAAKAILASISLVVLASITLLIPDLRPYALLLAFGWLQVAGSVITADWYLQGMEMMGRFATASIVGRIVPIPFIFLFVRSSNDTAIAALLQSLSSVIAGCLSLYFAAHTGAIGRVGFSLRSAWSSIRSGFYLFLSSASVSLYSNLNTLMLFTIAGPVQGGLFVGADKLRRAAQGLIGPISAVMYPRITNMLANDAERANQWTWWLLKVQGAFTLMLSVLTWIVAPLAVRLILGPQYTEAVWVLRALAPVLFLVGINNVLGIQMLLPRGMKREFMLSVAVPGLLSLTYMPLLAYLYGAVGVASALSITELLVNVIAAGFLFRDKTSAALPRLPNR